MIKFMKWMRSYVNSKPNTLKKRHTKQTMEKTIPWLMTFKTIQHMREYKDKEE